jgi:hypothetical protein
MTTLDQAIAQMRANGMPEFPPGHPKVGVGRITRYGPKKNAWYVLHCYRTRGNREVIVGAFGLLGQARALQDRGRLEGLLVGGARGARGARASRSASSARSARTAHAARRTEVCSNGVRR